jgi:hypothetical protein
MVRLEGVRRPLAFDHDDGAAAPAKHDVDLPAVLGSPVADFPSKAETFSEAVSQNGG